MLSKTAIEVQRYIIGGSIPELDPANSTKIYNTMTVWDPKGQ